MTDQLINTFSLRGNWVDLVFILIIVYYALNNQGFVSTFLEALGFLFSLFVSYKIYDVFGKLLITNFSFPRGIANAVGFMLAWFLAETAFYLFITQIILRYVNLKKFEKNPLNVALGFLAGIIQASFLFLFAVSVIFSFPVRPQLKQAILNSRSGPYFINLSNSFEKQLKNVFGGAINETLNFLTVKPKSGESIDLGIKVSSSQLSEDPTSEVIMLDKINQERVFAGAAKLTMNNGLRDLARDYGRTMFINGFFSHVSAVDGTSPGDRANRAGINYSVLGENLAFAPDVYIAHQGLMNSPGHRANIMSLEYHKVGIGVINGGVYGRMFVQEFSD